MTHEHEDHFGGLQQVLTEYSTDNFVYSTCDSKSCITRILNRVSQSQQIKARAGTILDVDPDIDMRVLSPPQGGFADVNDNSVVIKLAYGDKSYLFMGDAEEGAEEYMMDTYDDLDIDIIKVGHHGSDNSLTQEFLDATTPEKAVISVGDGNSYGHPTQSTLDLLSRNNIEVLRTDKIGDIVLT